MQAINQSDLFKCTSPYNRSPYILVGVMIQQCETFLSLCRCTEACLLKRELRWTRTGRHAAPLAGLANRKSTSACLLYLALRSRFVAFAALQSSGFKICCYPVDMADMNCSIQVLNLLCKLQLQRNWAVGAESLEMMAIFTSHTTTSIQLTVLQ